MKNMQILLSMYQTERLWLSCVSICNVGSLFMGITQFKGHSSHWNINGLKNHKLQQKMILKFLMVLLLNYLVFGN